MRRGVSGLLAAALTTIPFAASAQVLWTPLDTVPRPNAIIAHDKSVTMGINSGCTNCHLTTGSRLDESKADILATLPLFAPYFTFGGYQYEGCDFAKVTTRVVPTPDTPEVSLAQISAAISGAEACGSKENRLPGGSATSCATAGCGGDTTLAVELANLALPGFDPLRPFLHVDCAYTYVGDFLPCVFAGAPTDAVGYRNGCYHVGCTDIGGIDGLILAVNQLPNIDWPRWTESGLTPQQVQDDFCTPMRAVLEDVYNQIIACRPENAGYSTFPSEILGTEWCNPTIIAGSACTAASPLDNTCVCDNTDPACISGGNPESACGLPLTWKARQQVAVCESWQLGGVFDSFFTSQEDNVVNGECRENAVLFFTDGYMGQTAGVDVEGFNAVPTYESANGFSNMAVFRVSDVFSDMANAMMASVTDDVVTAAYSATDAALMQESFSRLLNRIYKGVYTSAALTFDSQGTRAVFHSFTVPGYSDTAPVQDTYLGWPGRLSMYDVDDTGAIAATPRFETDWADRVGATAPGCALQRLGNENIALLGPGGQFRNGVDRTVNVPPGTMDRDGDGFEDAHPALRLGSMYSIAATRPVIVEAPREAPNGKYGGDFVTFQNSNAIRTRPRAIYVMGNGYVHGYFGGAYDATPSNFGLRRLAFSYDDGSPFTGSEILRYGPQWVTAAQPVNDYRYDVNDLIQQPMTTGQLTAHEARIRYAGTYQFRTVLVGAQGKGGKGFFSLDVTDPCNPTTLAEWSLPGASDRASTEPIVYSLPNGSPDDTAVVITTGGLNGSATLYAHDITDGSLVTSTGLAGGGGSYLGAPICLDATGDARLTHCYVLREDGTLLRVPIGLNGAFGAYQNITPAGVVGGGQRFSTTPAVFFDPAGNVNLVFGAGDFERLNLNGPANSIYKVVDRDIRRKTVGAAPADIDTACGNLPSGRIPLGPQERVISPPAVAKGVVAWSTYTPSTNGCVAGDAKLYTMNYLTCTDAVTGAGPPQPTDVGPGLPTTPQLHRDSQTFIVGTSAGPTPDQAASVEVRTKGGGRIWAKRLYWRAVIDAR